MTEFTGTSTPTSAASPTRFRSVLSLDEWREIDETTGGEKNQKSEQYSLIPVPAFDMLARVYAYGAGKYDRNNWRRGYPWHLSFDAMMRHLNAFWNGEDLDPESGLPHVAHAMFHCATLLTFMQEYPEGDDRYVRTRTGN